MTQNPPGKLPERLGRNLLLGAAIVGAFATGGVLVASRPALALAASMHGGMGHGGMGHGDMGGMGGPGMHMMAAAHLDAMLDKADASDEQKTRIHEIMKRALTSLAPLHGRMQETHAELHALLTAPRIDRAALERLRAARIADVDRASRVIAAALADSAEVLTPEQRAKLGAQIAAHQARP